MRQARVRKLLHTVAVVMLLTFVFTVVPAALGQPSGVQAYQAATDFRYPLNSGGWFLGQAFGVWNSDRRAYHLAEYLLPNNRVTELPVYAPANGQVKYSAYQSGSYGYGHVVVIEHRLPDNTYVCSVLGHLRKANLVARGTDVAKGQLIGYISNDPRQNGGYNFAHLHFGIRSGPYSTARDPDGGWRYRGYTSSTAIRALWYNPSKFVEARVAPEPVKQTGSLRVGISPQGAIDAGAQWRIVGTTTWRNNGYTLSGIPAGSYTIEFKSVSGWQKPANQSVTITASGTATESGAYTRVSAPTLSVSTTSLSFGSIRVGNYTNAQSYLVTGSNLSGRVLLEAPDGFWISLNRTNVSSYRKTITLNPSNGAVNQRIYVSFLPPRSGTYSGYITHESSGVTTTYLRVTGRGY